MFDAYMIYQAQPTLNLSDEQWLSFGLKLRNLLTIRHRLQRQRLEALGGLRELLKTQGPLDEAVVAEKLRAYDELTLQSAPEVRQAYAAIDQVLRPRQRVQFRAFEEAMERKKLELIAMARQRQQVVAELVRAVHPAASPVGQPQAPERGEEARGLPQLSAQFARPGECMHPIGAWNIPHPGFGKGELQGEFFFGTLAGIRQCHEQG